MHGALGRPHAEEYFLAVLGKKARSSLKHSGLAAGFRFYRNGRTDSVTISARPPQAESNRRRQIPNHVVHQPQLRTVAVFQEQFLAAILIEIGQSVRPP